MKKSIIFTILLLAILPFAYAEPNFFVKITPIKSAITVDDSARFMLSIYNNQTYADTFTFTPKDTILTVSSDPSTDYWNGITIPAQSEGKTIIRFTTGQNLKPQLLPGTQLRITSKKNGEETSAFFSIEILPRTKFPIDVSSKILTPYFVDPRNKLSIRASLNNHNGAKYENLKLSLKGKYVSRDIDVQLAPNENKTVEFTIDFDKATSPGKDTLTLELKKEDKVIAKDTAEIEIVEYSEPFKKSESAIESFQKKTTTITLENDGNVAKQQTITYPASLFDTYFTKTDPKAKYAGTSKEFTWQITLRAGETTQITIVKNTIPLFYLAIFLIAYAILYFSFRSPLSIRKEIMEVIEKEGGISEIKIKVKIKNRSKKPVKSIRLIERIPEITVLHAEKDQVAPTKAYKYKDGSVLEWQFAEIESKEERIITYKIKARLIIMGNLKLKPAVVRFGKRKIFSGPTSVYTK